MKLDRSFSGKRILITGHTGFKGSWLSIWLKELGAEVIGFSLDPWTEPNLFDAANLKEKMIDLRGNINNPRQIMDVIHKYEPDVVFHMAAQPIVKESYKNPHLTFETNVMGLVNVLEAIRLTGSVRVFINITTDKCYENMEWEYSYRENDRLGGHDPYSASKACSEIVTATYRNSFFPIAGFNTDHNLLIASVRAGNVLGGGDWGLHRLVPDCIRSLQHKEPILIRNPNAIRPWQFVLEPLSGYLLLCTKLLDSKTGYSGAWNFGPYPGDSINVRTVTESIIKIWGDGSYEITPDNEHHEANILRLDIAKAETQLGWSPVYGVKDAIHESISWYKKYYEGDSDMYDYSVKQIKKYTAGIK